MVFAVQELQLDSRTAALVARNQVAELAENVTTNLVSIRLNASTTDVNGDSHLHHVLVTSLRLQSLKYSLCCITLVNI